MAHHLPEYLEELQHNLAIYRESLREISAEVRSAGVSQYPIFVAHKQGSPIGKLVIDKDELALEWSINASTLEEFVLRKIVLKEKLNFFKLQYKNPDAYCCIFSLHEKASRFIFLPYE